MLNAKYVVGMDGQPLLNPEAYGNAWFVNEVQYVDNPDREMEALSIISPDSVAVADVKFSDVLGKSRPVMPGDTIYETTYAPNRLTYRSRSANGGVAVFSEVFFPWGWTATVDGNEVPIGRVNYVLRAIDVPAGEHTIEMKFNPKSLQTTDTAATVAIILIYILALGAIAMAVIRVVKPTVKNESVQRN